MQDDWRLAGNERLFRGAVFARKRYIRFNDSWDHDHCSFCWVTFDEEGPDSEQGAVHEGYSAPGPPADPKDDYYWVCPGCFADFREYMGWTLRTSPG